MANSGSCLCVGLDPRPEHLPDAVKELYPDPESRVMHFLKTVIDVTRDHCAAFKPNLAFFEALGGAGMEIFRETVEYIPDEKIVIADAKRGDISSTAERYCHAYFEQFGVDAVTLNPLMGFDTLSPFLNYPDNALYLLVLTTNPGAGDLLLHPFSEFDSMAEYIADRLNSLKEQSDTHIGMVVGATHPEEMKPVISRYTEGSLLIPGIGAQGGSVEALEGSLRGHKGLPLISSSRRIIYAGREEKDWHTFVGQKAADIKKELKSITERYV